LAYTYNPNVDRALALDESIQSLGYTALYSFGYTEALTIYLAVPDLVSRILMEYSALEDCMKRGEDAEGDLLWTAVDYGGWQAGRVGCIKREGFEEGIPAWLVSPSVSFFHRNLVWAIGRAKDLSLITHRVCVE
jgi:hypothetical protein